eukprot:176873_1
MISLNNIPLYNTFSQVRQRNMEIVCWYIGSNFYGQVGNGVETTWSFPNSLTKKKVLTKITKLPDQKIIDIKTGRHNVYYLLLNGECRVAGNNDKQQLLTSNEATRKLCFLWSQSNFIPWDICFSITVFLGYKINCPNILQPICIHQNIQCISNGVVSDHRFIINQHGELYGVGTNHSNQFNIGDIQTTDIEINIKSLNFVKINYFAQNNIELKQIHCSMGYSIFLTKDHKLFVCGTSSVGGLGLGTQYESNGIQLISIQKEIIDVCCGVDHTLILTKQRNLYSFGWNSCGQLGIGHTKDQNYAQLITSLKDKKIVTICSGYQHNMIKDSNGLIYCFGDNNLSQCGISEGNHVIITKPTEVVAINNNSEIYTISDMKCGAYHNVICSNFEDYLLWGDNEYNQCIVKHLPEYVKKPLLF